MSFVYYCDTVSVALNARHSQSSRGSFAESPPTNMICASPLSGNICSSASDVSGESVADFPFYLFIQHLKLTLIFISDII